VALVVAFHAGLPGVTGGFVGVDVFYVISGFVITRVLVAELEQTGSIAFASFYARRIRRLLPLAALVLAATAVGMYFFTPPVFRPAVRFDAIAAALDYANWQFALESVNYLTLGAAQDPVLHYWSLSVEEQFYLFWPLLLLAAARLLRGRGRVRLRAGTMLLIVGGASLAWSLVYTPREPAIAYFATTTRAWEFAVGGAIALLVPELARLSRPAAATLGLGGLGLLLAAAVIDGPTTAFPGTAALAPVLGAAAVIAAGVAGPVVGAGRLLSNMVLRFVGRISYAWYLWHWPCLVFARTARWSPANGSSHWWVIAIAVALSFALAVVSHYLVEVPLRHARMLAGHGKRIFALAGAMVAAAVVAVGITGGPFVLPGGLGITGGAEAGVAIPDAITPLAAQASTPYAAMHGCHVAYGATGPASGCVFGDATGRRTVVLLGDSHAAQWFPALSTLAVRERFRLVAWTKSGCPFAPAVNLFLPAIGRGYTECLAWQASVVRQLRALPRPALVILGRISTYLPQVRTADGDVPADGQAPLIWGAGMAAAVRTLEPLASRVVVLRDTPHAPSDVPACLSWDPSNPATCSFPRPADGHFDDAEVAAELDAGVPRGVYADPVPAVCPAAVCPAVVGDIVVYRDDNHLTAAFAATRWRQLAAALARSDVHRPALAGADHASRERPALVPR
jgi:peptidoglycan/LPS O-acetylase OafA/YrhL